jgi:hypothetical protein
VTVVRIWRSERLMDETLGEGAEQALQPGSAPEGVDSAEK